MMLVYAIRHKPTGKFMPVPTGRGGSGSSYWDPLSENTACTKINEVPRLFTAERNAKAALTQWLRGQHKPIDYLEHGECFGKPYLVRDSVEVTIVSSRKAEDMEVVTLTVQVVD